MACSKNPAYFAVDVVTLSNFQTSTVPTQLIPSQSAKLDMQVTVKCMTASCPTTATQPGMAFPVHYNLLLKVRFGDYFYI